MAVVEIIKKKCVSFARPDLMNLMRVLASLAIQFNFKFWIEHVPGVDNKTADILSRQFKSDDIRGQAQKHCPVQLSQEKDAAAAAINYCLEQFFKAEPSAAALQKSEKDWRSLTKNLF
jgi:hypothetical protein